MKYLLVIALAIAGLSCLANREYFPAVLFGLAVLAELIAIAAHQFLAEGK